jgi:hypothetical protein
MALQHFVDKYYKKIRDGYIAKTQYLIKASMNCDWINETMLESFIPSSMSPTAAQMHDGGGKHLAFSIAYDDSQDYVIDDTYDYRNRVIAVNFAFGYEVGDPDDDKIACSFNRDCELDALPAEFFDMRQDIFLNREFIWSADEQNGGMFVFYSKAGSDGTAAPRIAFTSFVAAGERAWSYIWASSVDGSLNVRCEAAGFNPPPMVGEIIASCLIP